MLAQLATSGAIAGSSKLLATRSAWLALRQFLLQSWLIAPMNWAWYREVEKRLKHLPPTKYAALATLVEMMLFNPLINAWFIIVSARVLPPRSRVPWETWWATTRSYVYFWGPVGVLTYRFVPLHLRIAFSSACNFFWQLHLARSMAAQESPKVPRSLEACKSPSANALSSLSTSGGSASSSNDDKED